MEIKEKKLRKGHPDYAISLNNLAGLLEKKVRDDALAYFASAFTTGVCEPRRSRQRRLAAARQGKYAEAEPLYVRAMEITEETFGKNHPEYCSRLNNLAQVMHFQVRVRMPFGLSIIVSVIYMNSSGLRA